MGAIVGRLSFDPEEILARTVLEQMLETSATPLDERALFTGPGIALGSCASARGHAAVAMATKERQTIRVVADAGLTNAGELRTLLAREGRQFTTQNNDELIAHAYDRWGTACFERLRGPFACAVWDEPNRRLVLARDHIGIRPLFFALLHGHGLVFASELRALFQDPGVAREWCPDGIDAYLALGYVPAPLTAYRRVSKLEPAHFLLVEGRRLHVEEFWDFPVTLKRNAPHDVAWAIKGALKGAVRRELTDNKRAGLLYSGGVASCALLASAPPTSGIPVTVETDQEPSELTRSDAAAAHLGRVRELETLASPLSSLIDDVTTMSAEPVADPSAVTQLAVCRAVARHADEALSAHGAAALWAGYARHRITRADTCVANHASGFWDDWYRRAIYTRAFAWQVRDTNPFGRHAERYASRLTNDPIDRAIYVDARTSLPDSTLVIARTAAAQAGISLRYPFLDRQMVELAAATPGAMKRQGRVGLYALRRLLSPMLPARLMPPAKPQPASHAWLSAVLPVLVPAMLLDARFDGRGIVSRPALRHLWEDHQAARSDHSLRLWALLMLEFWFRNSIDGDAAAEPLEYAVLVKAA